MTLRNWVKRNGGPKKTAMLLTGTRDAAIRMWLRGDNTPRASTMYEIYKLTRGRVSYKTMIEETLGVGNAKRR